LEFVVACIRASSQVLRGARESSSHAGPSEADLRHRWRMPTPSPENGELEGGYGDLPAWGGMQVVVVGDFFQLPPVNVAPQKMQGLYVPPQPGAFRAWGFAFESSAWWHSGLHAIQLTEVFRQHGDDGLLDFLHDMRLGRCDEQNHRAIRTALTRNDGQLPTREDGIKPTTLYADNKSVDATNSKELSLLPGRCFVFEAVDKVGLSTPWKKKLLRRFGLNGAPLNSQFCSDAKIDGIPKPDQGRVSGGFMPMWRDPDEKAEGEVELEAEIAKAELTFQSLRRNGDYGAAMQAVDQELNALKARLESLRGWLVSLEQLSEWMTRPGQSLSDGVSAIWRLDLPRHLERVHAFQKSLDRDRKTLRLNAKNLYFEDCRVDKLMSMKREAQVMLLVNEDVDKGLANGSRGRVVDIVSTTLYVTAFREEANARSENLGDFDHRKRRLNAQRQVREDALCKDQGMSATMAHAATEEWYRQESTRLAREYITKREQRLSGVSEAVSRAIKCMSEGSFLAEQRRMDGFDAQKWTTLPVVQFTNGEVRVCTPRKFQKVWPALGFAWREQIPLKKAWAISIHKSQGMTIDWLVVDLQRVFAKGQVYVGLSRGTSTETMVVRNFDVRKVAASREVVKFYEAMIHGQPEPAREYMEKWWEHWFAKLLRNRSEERKHENECVLRTQELAGKLCERCGLQLELRLQQNESNRRYGQWFAMCPESKPPDWCPPIRGGMYYPWS
jgi:hypothetical protein